MRVSGRSGVAASRIAAIGAIRDARSAGSSAAITRDRDADRVGRDDRRGRQADARSSCSDAAADVGEHVRQQDPTPKPAAEPTVEASTPMTTASMSTEPIICRRLPPSARSNASSFVRWATMIENVFRIRKMPTNSATPAKPRKMSLTNPSRLWQNVADWSAASCLPVFAT